MYDISINRTIILIFVTLVYLLVTLKCTYTGIQNMYYVFSILGITIYSGVSTIIVGLCDEYFIPYLVFLGMYTFGFIFAIKFSIIRTSRGTFALLTKSRKEFLEDYYCTREDSPYYIPDMILKASLFFFFSYYLVQLVYPEFRLLEIFHLSINTDNIFVRRDGLRGNIVYQVFYYLNLMTVVLVFIYSYKKFRQGKWGITILVFGGWYYLQKVTLGYISRGEILTILVFIVLILENRNRNEIKLSAKIIIIGAVGLVMLTPFLNAYELIRMGVTAESKGLLESLGDLFIKEATYGKYYDFCASYGDSTLILKYIVWFITLPLPSGIFGTIKSYGLQTNTLFTVAYTGIKRGSYNYSVILPSILGESLMIYGRYLYWIHAIFIGVFFGFLCKKMESNKDLTLLNLYFAIYTFILGRGGSEAVIASMVNYMVMFWIVSVIVRKQRKSRNHN